MKRHFLLGLSSLVLVAACASTPSEVESSEMSLADRYADVHPSRHETPIKKTASLWNQEPQSLFGNRRARNVGDILTVIVSVADDAQMQNSLTSNRSNTEDFSLNALFGLPQSVTPNLPDGTTLAPAVNLARTAQAQGDGTITRQERITLRLAAEVVEQLDNGHLVIIGTQKIRVNSEIRDLRLYGVVRPEDITRDNTISHDKIASADIVYTGRGQITRDTQPKFGSRLLDILVPF